MTTDPALEFDIVKSYGRFTLSCKASFEQGITAVFGPSGSGKSTLLDSIAGLIAPDSGHITAFGKNLYSSSNRKNVRPEKRRFGYVSQDSALFPHMNVEDNIHYGYRLTPAEHRTIEPDQLIELFQLSALLGSDIGNLSGGERQRVALARALAASPRLLLLDEPLASLDAGFKGPIIRYLSRIWRDLQIPMVYVSHSMSEVMALAHDVLVINDGAVVTQGRASHVLSHPNVTALADYATLENIIEAEIATPEGNDGATILQVGPTRLAAPASGHRPGKTVTFALRANDILLALEPPSRISAQNILEATVQEIQVSGPRVFVSVDIGATLTVEITPNALKILDIQTGQQLYVIIKSTSIMLLDSPA
jgi:molybdate transport system ATP-binding protein